MQIDEKLKTASDNYKLGYTCSQAVFSAYADELGLERKKVYRLMEVFGEGCSNRQEVCSALAVCLEIISLYCSDERIENENFKELTVQKTKQAEMIFKQEYGGIICGEILHGAYPKKFQCGMKVKDAILIIENVLADIKANYYN